MDAFLTKSQKEIKAAVAEFAKGEFDKELALEMEKKRTFPDKIHQKACELGFIGLHFPETYDGLGLGIFENILVAETLCQADSSIGSALMLSSYGAETVLRFADEALKEEFLPKVVQGKMCCGLALKTDPPRKDKLYNGVSAVKTGNNCWIINGTGSYVLNAGRKGFSVVSARNSDETEAPMPSSLFLVENDRPGVTTTDLGHKTGINMVPMTHVHFENVAIPAGHLIGRAGQGAAQVQAFFNENRILIAAMALGMAQGALDRTIAYIKGRAQFGRKLAKFQVTRHKIAAMAAKIESARMLTYHAAKQLDQAKTAKGMSGLSAMAKWMAARAAVEVTDEALQLFGGYGYMTEYEIERFYRDAKVMELLGESRHMLKEMIARDVIGNVG